jgi:hypothetical protein
MIRSPRHARSRGRTVSREQQGTARRAAAGAAEHFAAINRRLSVLAGVEPGENQPRTARRTTVMHSDTLKYNESLGPQDREISNLLAREIDQALPEAENKIWHAHPVWFLDGNPVVGYSKLKECVRLLFWSGQSFEEEGLKKEGSFKAAEVRYTAADQVNVQNLNRWLAKARDIQWDYKNIARRKGGLERLK